MDEVVSVVTATLTSGTHYRLGSPASAEVTVRDDDPVVSFTAPEPITEADTAVFTFTRSGGVSHELEVSVSVLPTGDFLSGTAPTWVTFAAGDTEAPLSIPLVDDSTLEGDGHIAVLLRQGTDYDTTGTLLQQVSVMDNDRPVVTITAVTTPIDEGASAVFSVEATGGVITEAFDVPVAMTESGSMISGSRDLAQKSPSNRAARHAHAHPLQRSAFIAKTSWRHLPARSSAHSAQRTAHSAQRAVPAPPAPESSTGSQAPPPGSESGSLLGQSAGQRRCPCNGSISDCTSDGVWPRERITITHHQRPNS